jgi:hypothetical protein
MLHETIKELRVNELHHSTSSATCEGKGFIHEPGPVASALCVEDHGWYFLFKITSPVNMAASSPTTATDDHHEIMDHWESTIY